MRIRCIMAQRACRYPGEYAPELLDAWSQYVLEDNPEGYAEALRKEEERVGSEYDMVRELDLLVDDMAINELFEIPVAEAEVERRSGEPRRQTDRPA